MLAEVSLHWHTYRFLPYEKALGLKEVQALTGVAPVQSTGRVILPQNGGEHAALRRLTYFRHACLSGNGMIVPMQGQLEAIAQRHSASGDSDKGPRLARQRTRYSVHGLHEYKGKFNPQIVRVISNLLIGRTEEARILDPFCGSGTSLVEMAHMGWDGIGLDQNPLAVYISNTKLQAIRICPSILDSAINGLRDRLVNLADDLDCDHPFSASTHRKLANMYRRPLPNQSYLEAWFTPSVLAQLRAIRTEIHVQKNQHVRNIALVVLSDILRTVSLQDPADLRTRRRSDARENYPAISIFLATLAKRIQVLLATREILGPIRGEQKALLADSRLHWSGDQNGRSLFDAVITSPPYATALPYIDTQRLSLAFLGLVCSSKLAATERQLIGNRDISKTERLREEASVSRTKDFPEAVTRLCQVAMRLAADPSNGFRRRNVPALLHRYFGDMRGVFKAIQPRIRKGGHFAMVVGPNRSTLGGQPLVIKTPELLALIAESVGWTVDELIPLNAYQRFGLHRKNSITSETLVILRH